MVGDSRDDRSREFSAWHYYGPVVYRIRQLLFAATTILLTIVLMFVYLTISSFYPGTGSARPYGPAERSVEVTVEECRRVGPLSDHGFGYWWVCDITVLRGAGVNAVVDRSIATPEDVGRVISLREACYGENQTDCRYGEPTSAIWPILMVVLRMLWRGFLVVALFMVLIYLMKSILGAPRSYALVDRLRGKRGNV
ncbi:DUF6346 domain-containing protein [Solwaraspora sp. WMMB335]|uniref:DUF6346 domain-containing protein n=1 Tax=Solwaraspora sp. WMMB335 TaxID=3404118 RepID=UPI003B946FE3